MSILNLDRTAAQYAQRIISGTIREAGEAKAVEKLITKTLGVLQEQGVYACLLFLFSRTSHEKSLAEKTRRHLYSLLKELPTVQENEVDDQNALAFFADTLCNDLDNLLLVKSIYEQTLIYARYGAKAADT